MKIESSAFKQGEAIPVKYSCDGDDVNPPLLISEVPPGTVSLILLVEDPDAPSKTFVHWLVFNIDPSLKQINENSVPEGANLGTNDFGSKNYGGPCPPSGKHRYFFKLFAIDIVLDLDSGASKETVLTLIRDHTLGYAELMGVYGRYG
ncbi:YbhB/YbcL family Raf kinase inhibitor-like protein [Candidatus Collierbacteria bacterium]|nr:YbhB/YbcL family Raf kinase inhibitor-like protein [Candidatus Collierbacteria bacterium]